MSKDNIKIIVATHKKYKMPSDDIYVPIHVGREQSKELGYIGDNTGENISNKNSFYCELTGLYWGWKNLECEYLGLVHYRRHLTNSNLLCRNKENKYDDIIGSKQIEKLLKEVDVILPSKRKYYIETIYSHYIHTLEGETLDETKVIIDEFYPEYSKSFEDVMNRRSAHMFNMFIMKKTILNDYCEWLFSILDKLEKRIDPSQYDSFHARYLGRISELLLDVWLDKNKIKYKEVPILEIENTNNMKRIVTFLKAKFLKQKYGASF